MICIFHHFHQDFYWCLISTTINLQDGANMENGNPIGLSGPRGILLCNQIDRVDQMWKPRRQICQTNDQLGKKWAKTNKHITKNEKRWKISYNHAIKPSFLEDPKIKLPTKVIFHFFILLDVQQPLPFPLFLQISPNSNTIWTKTTKDLIFSSFKRQINTNMITFGPILDHKSSQSEITNLLDLLLYPHSRGRGYQKMCRTLGFSYAVVWLWLNKKN